MTFLALAVTSYFASQYTASVRKGIQAAATVLTTATTSNVETSLATYFADTRAYFEAGFN